MVSRRATPIVRLSCLGFLIAAHPLVAQEVAPEIVIPTENVSFDYAQVLAVDPVFQTLRTTRSERVCDESPEAQKRGLSRVLGAVKDSLGAQMDQALAPAQGTNCRMVPVTRDFRRPIAYDVDYVYKGSKYRTRMARDPGNRLRVRVSITPQPMAGP